jgi:hypothetical protein
VDDIVSTIVGRSQCIVGPADFRGTRGGQGLLPVSRANKLAVD